MRPMPSQPRSATGSTIATGSFCHVSRLRGPVGRLRFAAALRGGGGSTAAFPDPVLSLEEQLASEDAQSCAALSKKQPDHIKRSCRLMPVTKGHLEATARPDADAEVSC